MRPEAAKRRVSGYIVHLDATRTSNIVMPALRLWRNWQTRKVQVLVTARSCRFKSYQPH